MVIAFFCPRSSLDANASSRFHLVAEEMDAADNELREVICNIWPNLAKKQVKLHEGGTKSLLDLVVPPKNGLEKRVFVFLRKKRFVWLVELHGTPGHPKLTVGKVYAINLFIDNHRSYKQGHTNDGVSEDFDLSSFRFCCALLDIDQLNSYLDTEQKNLPTG